MPNSHNHKTNYFPKGFLWGTATSAHQVEGNNYNNDWWAYEQEGKIKFPSGKACDHYQQFEEDFDLAKDMNNNAHRLSVEWSRIEPRPGVWNEPAVEHYRKVLRALKERGMQTMVTLLHFTLPQWFAHKGGFEKTRNVYYFTRYVRYIAEQLDGLADFWITINEPGVYIYQGYTIGDWVPLKKDKKLAFKVYVNLALAHRRTYKIIHSLARHAERKTMVGIAQNMLSFATYRKHSLFDNAAVWFNVNIANHGFYKLTGRKTHDFYGINYYFRVRLKRKKGTFKVENDDITYQGREESDIGWEIYPHGLFDVLMDFKDYKKPIYITENGIATVNDDRRERFIVAHLREIYHAVKGGADVRGYFFWSLIDNFEWHLGFAPKFGLVEVDFDTQKRSMRQSGRLYGEIAKINGLKHEMYRFLGHGAK